MSTREHDTPYSPAPWRISPCQPIGESGEWEADHYIQDAEGHTFAMVFENVDDADGNQQNSDAALIAAAPLMYEALREVVELLYGELGSAQTYRKAKAALKAAEGKEV